MRGHSEALSDLSNICDKVRGEGSATSAKSQLDWSCACKVKAGILQKETVWAKAAKRLFEAWYKMYVKPRHPGNGGNALKLFLGPRVSKIGKGLLTGTSRNRLELEATKMLVYVYSNSKMVAATGHANEHNMLAWTVHQMKMHRYNMTTSDHTPLRAPAGGSHSPGEARVAESLSRSF